MPITQTIVLEITEVSQTGFISMDPGQFAAGDGSAGFMTGADKDKLDTMEAYAEPNTIDTIYNLGEQIIPDENKRIDLMVPFISFYGDE